MTALIRRGGFLAGLSIALAALAQGQELGPEELIRKMTVEVLDAIRADKQLAAGDRQKALKLAEEKVLPHINFTEAARIAVGPTWFQATPAQQTQLALQFRRMLIRVYSSAISAYSGQTMKVLPVQMDPDDTRATVRNEYLRPGQAPILVVYSMRKVSEGWKIYDVSFQGVSLVLAYRAEFAAILKKDGIDGLIKLMMEKNAPVPLSGEDVRRTALCGARPTIQRTHILTPWGDLSGSRS